MPKFGSFSKWYIDKITFPASTAWYLTQCGEARGMQDLWKQTRPEVLKNLRESAIIQSTESSNRIEGVEVRKDRLVPLVLGKARPQDRSEEEIIGYRKALTFIHRKHAEIEIHPKTILTLHAYAQGGLVGDAGKWKTRGNEIIEISPKGDRRVRFKPLSAERTPKAMEQLCLGYADLASNAKLPDLTLIANFIFDFLCIHPFQDGNGRVSRLLTLLLLYRHGYEVGRYISLERIIEDAKEDYYRVLGECSVGWREGRHDLIPWWNFQLGMIRAAYQELRERVEATSEGGPKSSLIRETALSFRLPFSISEIQRLHPGIGRELIKKVLLKMREGGLLEPMGKGRGAKWRVKVPGPIW